MLQDFLNKKPLYYKEIDYTRMPKAYNSIKKQLTLPKIIHIIGTNGKGTTGRFLAEALFRANYNVGHYTSPHILHFNERIWINAKLANDTLLEEAHQKLLTLLTQEMAEALSYFEYTTLLAMVVFQKCDYVVLEAGLGGEHDATAVFKNILTLVTPIAQDHEAFLGTTIQEIATTKLQAVQTAALLAEQPFTEVYTLAQEIADKKGICIQSYKQYLTQEDYHQAQKIADKLTLSSYLQENLLVSIAALHYLHVSYTPESFSHAKLFGRLTQLSKNVIIDVGHNLLAAKALVKSLQGKQYILVYNSYKDKNYSEILTCLKPLIKRVEILEIEDIRKVQEKDLHEVMKHLALPYTSFETIQEDEEYLVFGSFSVIEKFLKEYHHG